MGTMTNSEDPNEMLHKAAFHQGLHCLLKAVLRENKYNIVFVIITCNSSIYTMDHRDLTVSTFMENTIGLKRVKKCGLLTVLM